MQAQLLKAQEQLAAERQSRKKAESQLRAATRSTETETGASKRPALSGRTLQESALTKSGELDWSKCNSEKGGRQCALCRGDETKNGMLPCDLLPAAPDGSYGAKYAACPDHLILKKRKFFRPGRNYGQCVPLSIEGALEGVGATSYHFPQVSSEQHPKN